uniref:Secreted protein n=1 Tax=Oryza sativa subsp. japonica TaxID=39947 RepID=Q6K8U1_ORYSJ|nr:hypothetical protein [Oryza sativa Japonica Group]
MHVGLLVLVVVRCACRVAALIRASHHPRAWDRGQQRQEGRRARAGSPLRACDFETTAGKRRHRDVAETRAAERRNGSGLIPQLSPSQPLVTTAFCSSPPPPNLLSPPPSAPSPPLMASPPRPQERGGRPLLTATFWRGWIVAARARRWQGNDIAVVA